MFSKIEALGFREAFIRELSMTIVGFLDTFSAAVWSIKFASSGTFVKLEWTSFGSVVAGI